MAPFEYERRVHALREALHLTREEDGWGPTEVAMFAEYLRTGDIPIRPPDVELRHEPDPVMLHNAVETWRKAMEKDPLPPMAQAAMRASDGTMRLGEWRKAMEDTGAELEHCNGCDRYLRRPDEALCKSCQAPPLSDEDGS